MSNRYNTPQEGSLDWHVPLNENFERLDRDVEIRDAAGNRSNYEPKAGAKFLATDTYDVYLGDGNSWNVVGNLAASGDDGGTTTTTDGTALPTALANGNLVAVSSGVAATVDPSGTSTPVQNALDTIAAADTPGGNGGRASGIVYLPPGKKIRESGPIRFPVGAQGVHVQGTGASTATRPNCVIEITGNNPGLELEGWGTKFSSMEGITLKGTGQSQPAIQWNGSPTPRMFNLRRIRFAEWQDSQRGVMHFNTSHNFSNHFDTLMFATSCGGPCMRMESGDSGRLAYTQVTNMYADNEQGSHPVLDIAFQAPNVDFGLLNIGGSHDQVMDAQYTSNGHLSFQFINYEPKSAVDTGKPLIEKRGDGYLDVGHLAVNGFSGLNSIQKVYELYDGNNVLGPIGYRGNVTVTGPRIDLQGRQNNLSWFFGPSNAVRNSSGSSTGNFRTLDTAGTGNG